MARVTGVLSRFLKTCSHRRYCSIHLFRSSQFEYLKGVKFLIVSGADVNKAINGEFTPLFIASQNRHLKVGKFLIKKGAVVNKTMNDGLTFLQITI